MSRMVEGDGFDCEDEEIEFLRTVDDEFKKAAPLLEGFLAHLDAMPSKRIIANRFFRRKTGEACAVAEFCRFRGETPEQLHETQREVTSDLMDNDGCGESCDGWEGPTVHSGIHAGLGQYAAHDLAWHNDIAWARMRPETRWLRLRNYIAKRLDRPILEASRG
jgi:hypothetical protein